MKICIPTNDDKGKNAVLCDHFGSAPFFTFIDTETGAFEVMRNGGSDHVHGSCRPLEFMGKRTVDAVVCRGLGRGAFSRLQAGGVEVLISLEKDVAATIQALKEDRLLAMSAERACGGHGQAHTHGHPHANAADNMHARSHGAGNAHAHAHASGNMQTRSHAAGNANAPSHGHGHGRGSGGCC